MSADRAGSGSRATRRLACVLFGHRWVESGAPWNRGWDCQRCGRTQEPCDNCGGQHNPTHITICSVERRGPWAP